MKKLKEKNVEYSGVNSHLKIKATTNNKNLKKE